ncbi:MAG: response regulator [Burkholderiaceae bacterium]
MNILVVEDDPLIAKGLETALGRSAHQVRWVSDGLEAGRVLRSQDFDLVILDLGLPKRSGLEVLEDLRRSGSLVRVLILSARDATQDRVQGLDMGADDYLTKPFELEELLARVRALERRDARQARNTLTHGTLVLDLESMEVQLSGVPVPLSRREWALLRLMVQHPDRVYARAQIEQALYGWDEPTESNAIDVHIHHLRRKLGSEVIQTVRGIGYRLGPPPCA